MKTLLKLNFPKIFLWGKKKQIKEDTQIVWGGPHTNQTRTLVHIHVGLFMFTFMCDTGSDHLSMPAMGKIFA
jgi:hypothetical protein